MLTQPSTLNPRPQPSTLNLQPSTLNLQPSTLNPQTSTLKPQPSTLNSQPSTLTRGSSRPPDRYSILEYAAAHASTPIPFPPSLETILLQPFASTLPPFQFYPHLGTLPVSRPSGPPARLPRCSHLWVQLRFAPSSRAGEQQPASSSQLWILSLDVSVEKRVNSPRVCGSCMFSVRWTVCSAAQALTPPSRRYHDASFRIHRIRMQVFCVALHAGHPCRGQPRDDARSRDHRSGQWCVTHPCVRNLILPGASNIVPCSPILLANNPCMDRGGATGS